MDVSAIMNQVLKLSEDAAQNVQSQLNAQAMGSPEGMLKVQYSVQQYSVFINSTSAILKTVRDLVSGVIAKL